MYHGQNTALFGHGDGFLKSAPSSMRRGAVKRVEMSGLLWGDSPEHRKGIFKHTNQWFVVNFHHLPRGVAWGLWHDHQCKPKNGHPRFLWPLVSEPIDGGVLSQPEPL